MNPEAEDEARRTPAVTRVSIVCGVGVFYPVGIQDRPLRQFVGKASSQGEAAFLPPCSRSGHEGSDERRFEVGCYGSRPVGPGRATATGMIAAPCEAFPAFARRRSGLVGYCGHPRVGGLVLTVDLERKHFLYPEGIAPHSQGLGGTTYPGLSIRNAFQPQRGCDRPRHGKNVRLIGGKSIAGR